MQRRNCTYPDNPENLSETFDLICFYYWKQ